MSSRSWNMVVSIGHKDIGTVAAFQIRHLVTAAHETVHALWIWFKFDLFDRIDSFDPFDPFDMLCIQEICFLYNESARQWKRLRNASTHSMYCMYCMVRSIPLACVPTYLKKESLGLWVIAVLIMERRADITAQRDRCIYCLSPWGKVMSAYSTDRSMKNVHVRII